MSSRYARPFFLLFLGFAALASVSAQPGSGPDQHVVIVGSGTTIDSVVTAAIPRARHWVVLAGLDTSSATSRPALSNITASECAEAVVRFTLAESDGVPTDSTAALARGVAIPRNIIQTGSSGWSRTAFATGIQSGVSNPALPVAQAQDLFCVAYTNAVQLRTTGGPQTVTATLLEGENRSPLAPEEIRLATASTWGARYSFAPVRVDRSRLRAVIVDISAPSTYGFAGSLVQNGRSRGSYAVVLAAWDPRSRTFKPPTTQLCRSTQVTFRLRSPEKAGLASPSADVQAVLIGGGEASRLFPNEHRVASYRVPMDNARFLCIAEAPLELSTDIGLQQVVAEVKTSGTATTLSEGSQYLYRPGGSVPGIRASFNPVRVHARPRPMFGLLVGTEDVFSRPDTSGQMTEPPETEEPKPPETETLASYPNGEHDTDEEEVPMVGAKSALMAGFDFAIEPLLFGRWGRDARLTLATNVTGDVGDTIYVGLSIQSLFSLAATANPVDVTLGAAFPRSRIDSAGDLLDEVFLSGAITLDLGGSLKALQGIFAP
ncbi:MAG: hypothetical protein AAGK21_05415 [Bacteroidota bacterium]